MHENDFELLNVSLVD